MTSPLHAEPSHTKAMSQQHINLMHAGLLPTTTPFGATHALLACVGAMLLVSVVALGFSALADRLSRQAQQMDADAATLRQQSPETALGPTLEATRRDIARLRARIAEQQQVLNTLNTRPHERSGANPRGYLDALARQAEPRLWVTGLSLSAPTHTLKLQGRTTDPQALPGYLRRLGSEPLFQGRDFIDVKLDGVPLKEDGTGGYTEFSLQAVPSSHREATP